MRALVQRVSRAAVDIEGEKVAQIEAGNADLEAAFPHLTEQKFKAEVGNALVSSYTSTGDTEKAAAIVSQMLADQPTNTARRNFLIRSTRCTRLSSC